MTPMFALWASVLISLSGPVTEVAITPANEGTSVLITVDGSVQYRGFTMEGPNRLVVDLMGARNALPQEEFGNVNRGGIQSVHTSQYSEDVVRVVLVLDEMVGYSLMPDPEGLRITLDNPAGGFTPWTSGRTPVEPAYMASSPLRAAPNAVAQQSQARRISIQFTNSPIQDVGLRVLLGQVHRAGLDRRGSGHRGHPGPALGHRARFDPRQARARRGRG